MKLNGFKDLDQLMKLARKYGVTTVKLEGIEFTIDHAVSTKTQKAKTFVPDTFGEISANDKIDMPDAPSLTDLLFYSATGQTPEGEA